MMNKTKNGLSLKFKLMSLSLGVTALMGASSLTLLSQIAKTQEEIAFSGFLAQAESLGDAISAQFFERYGDVQTFALNPDIRSSERSVIVTALDAYSALYGIYDLILVVDARGRLVAVNSKGPDGKEIPVQGLYRHNFSSEPWFKAAMAGQFTEDKDKGFTGTFVEDVHVDPWISKALGGKRLASSFTTSIKNGSGQTVGVISNRAGSRWFESAFKGSYANLRQVGYPHARLDMINKEGQVLFHYTSDPASEVLAESRYDWDVLLKANLAKNGNAAAREAIKGVSGATLVTSETGETLISGYTPVDGPKIINSIGWAVIVADSRDEATASLIKAKQVFYVIFAFIIALSSMASYLFSTSLSKRLTALAQQLSHGSTEVSSAASNISDSSSELSEAATEQAAAIQETAASIDQVSAMVKKSADNASQSQTVSQSSRSNAERGQEAVQEMTQSISDISQSNAAIMAQVEDGNRRISEIVKVIAEIGNKTKVINDIVFQTKLLSFNASVEAARAGEHGKGFAVVAEEVGNLAQMSGNAAKEISSMLESSIQKVEGIVTETKSQVERLVVDSRSKVETGTRVAQKCGDSLKDILTTVQEVDGMVAEISSASKEQAQGVAEINKAMNQLDQVTQRNTGVSLQAATSAAQLSQQAKDLRAVVSHLQLLINGKSDGSAAAADAAQGGARPQDTDRPARLAGKVVPITSKRSPAESTLKIASGEGTTREATSGSASTPSKDDPRFEDV